jgi:hypothetical protein
MGVKVRRIIAAHAQDAAMLRLPRFRRPECLGTRQRPGRQCDTRREASLE